MGNAFLPFISQENGANLQVIQLVDHSSISYSSSEFEFSRLLSLANINFFDTVARYPMVWAVIHTLRIVPIPGRDTDYYEISFVHHGYVDIWYADYEVDNFVSQSLFVPDIKPFLIIPGSLFSTDRITIMGNVLRFDFIEWSIMALDIS